MTVFYFLPTKILYSMIGHYFKVVHCRGYMLAGARLYPLQKEKLRLLTRAQYFHTAIPKQVKAAPHWSMSRFRKGKSFNVDTFPHTGNMSLKPLPISFRDIQIFVNL